MLGETASNDYNGNNVRAEDLLMDSPLDHSAPVKTSPRLAVSDGGD